MATRKSGYLKATFSAKGSISKAGQPKNLPKVFAKVKNSFTKPSPSTRRAIS